MIRIMLTTLGILITNLSYSQVGINTANPQKSLDVEGTVRISNNIDENKPTLLDGDAYTPIYINKTTGELKYAPSSVTRVSGGFRPGGDYVVANFKVKNTIARVRFIHFVDNSNENNNSNQSAYSYGDFTIIGLGSNNPIRFVEVKVYGYNGQARAYTSNDTSITWTNGALGTTTITINQTTGVLRVQNTNTLVFSGYFEILGGI